MLLGIGNFVFGSPGRYALFEARPYSAIAELTFAVAEEGRITKALRLVAHEVAAGAGHRADLLPSRLLAPGLGERHTVRSPGSASGSSLIPHCMRSAFASRACRSS